MFRSLSEKAHAGLRVDAPIPHVGKLSISIGIIAVIFNSDLIQQSKGQTAINHMKRHNSAFVQNNLMNTKNYETDKNKETFNKLKSQLDTSYKQNDIHELMSGIN